MNIQSKKNETELILFLSGSFDSVTAPMVQEDLEKQLADVTKLVLDFTEVTFLSSAGIRCILWAEKHMQSRRGSQILRKVSNELKEVFVLTALDNVLTFE